MTARRIAVLGGGVVGTSIAWHLSRLGGHEVVLFEAGEIGQGSTGRSVGGVRTLTPHRLDAELSSVAPAAYSILADRSGLELSWHPRGYLLLVSTPEREEALDAALGHATDLGVAYEEVDPASAAPLLRGLRVDGVRRAVFTPGDGWIGHPDRAAVAYARLAAESGATVLDHKPVTGVEVVDSGYRLRAGGDDWAVDGVVVALNAFARPILDQLGVSLPCYPYPRHVFRLSHGPGAFHPAMPMTVFQEDDLCLRSGDGTVLAVVGQHEVTTTDCTYDESRTGDVTARIASRVRLPGLAVSHAWTGLRAMTPDRRGLVGRLPGLDDAWCAMGFSGHGFMHAPAVGQAMAELVAEGAARSFDLAELDPGRFTVDPWAGTAPVLEPGHR